MRIIEIHEHNIAAFSPLINANYFRQIKSGMLSAFGAVDEDTAVGILVFGVKKEGAFLLHEIFVASEYRQKGIATELLSHFMQLSLNKRAIIITSFDDAPDSYVKDLLLKFCFEIEDSGAGNYTVPLESIRKMSVFDGIKNTDRVIPIAQGNRILWKRFCQRQAALGNTLPSISYFPEAPEELNLCISTETEILGCVTGSRISGEEYELSYAYVAKGHPALLMPLLAVFRENLLLMAPASAQLHITAVRQTSVGLAEKLLPEGSIRIDRKVAFFGKFF